MNNYAKSTYSSNSINIAIVGGSGYSGLELLRIFKNHPAIGKIFTFGSQKFHPELDRNYFTVDKIVELASNFEVVFLATPAEVSLELAPQMLKLGKHVIDISGAFRLNSPNILEDYSKWYNFKHTNPELVQTAHYGLLPWSLINFNKSSPILIANPGCYATAILMALLPLLKNRVIKPTEIVIDAKSGTTGAGKKAEQGLLFSEVDGECRPYKIGRHQHLPEIQLATQSFAETRIDPHFSTHLLPVRRGIIAGIYAKLETSKTLVDVENAFKEFYNNYPLVKYSTYSSEQSHQLTSLKKVVGSAATHLSYVVEGDKLYLYSAIDNLLKGAASQAVENFNILHNLPITMGLEYLESIV